MTSLFFCNVAAVFAIATNPTNPSSITRNDTVSCNVVLSATPSNCNELSISNDLYNNINVLSSFSELEFECYDDGHVSVLHIDFEGNECESVINFEQIREMVDEFYG